MRGVNKFLPLVAILVVAWMVFSILSQTVNQQLVPETSLKTPQLAATPQGFPRDIEGKQKIPVFDPRFAVIDPLTQFKIPKAVIFSAPMGTPTGAFTYNAQEYWEDNPHRRGHHTGDDINGIAGGDSDLGDTVYSIAEGLVTYAGVPSPGWGNVLLIAHRVEIEGKEHIIQSMYAHLEHTHVTVDEIVHRGQQVGTVGNAAGQYLAHLHFEIRKGINLHIGPGYLRKERTQISPTQFLRDYLKDERIFTKSLSTMKKESWQDIEMKNPELLLEILYPEGE